MLELSQYYQYSDSHERCGYGDDGAGGFDKPRNQITDLCA